MCSKEKKINLERTKLFALYEKLCMIILQSRHRHKWLCTKFNNDIINVCVSVYEITVPTILRILHWESKH